MTRPPRILAGTEPPGGAVCLFPVIEELRARGAEVMLLSAEYAKAVFRRRGIRFLDLDAMYRRELDDSTIVEQVKRFTPDVLLTGVVGKRTHGLDYRIQRAGITLGIKRVALLDSWMNLASRFADEQSGDPFYYQPDKLGVPDRDTANELTDIGLERGRIEVVGHPYHAELKRLSLHQEHIRERVRAELKIGERESLLAFISEPLSWQREMNGREIGYDEFDAFSLLHVGAHKSGLKIALVLKDHPRQPTLAAEVGHRYHSINGVRLVPVVDENLDALDLVLAADIVAGMSSSLLVHAALLGKRVLCIQPGVRPEADMNVLTRRGLLPNLESVQEVVEGIWDGVVSQGRTETIRTLFGWEFDPAQRAAEMVLRMVPLAEEME